MWMGSSHKVVGEIVFSLKSSGRKVGKDALGSGVGHQSFKMFEDHFANRVD